MDVNLPGDSGLELVKHLRRHHSSTAVLMVTGVDDPLIADSALELGAYGYLVKPFQGNELVINVSNALRRRELEKQNREHREHLEQLALGEYEPFQEALNRLRETVQNGQAAEQTLLEIARLAEFRQHDSGLHLERMSTYCWLLAHRMGLQADVCEQICLSSMLHDVGKISVPESIIFKTATLTNFEVEVTRGHADFGYRMLRGLRGEFAQMAATIAWTHHERFDGTGYPRGLTAGAIPLEGRITAIADEFEALRSPTAQRPGYPIATALEIMFRERGKHFDPALLEQFVECSEILAAINEATSPEAIAWVVHSESTPAAIPSHQATHC